MALSLILLFITLFTSCLANPTSTPPSSTLTTTTTTTTTTTNSGTTTIITSEASATSGPCIDIQPIVGDCTGNLGQSLCPAWILRGECLLSCGACTPNPRIPTPVIDIFPPLPPSPPTTPTKSPTTIPPIKSSTGRRPPFSSSSSTGRGTGTGTGNGNGNGNDMSITNTNVTCFDVVPPPQPYTPPLTCAQYVQAGACATLQGFCRLSCGNCTIPTLSPATITMNTIMGSNESTAALVVRVIGITALIAIVIVVFLAWVSHRRAVRRVMSRVQGKHHAFTDLIQQRSQTNLLHENGAYVSSSLTPPPRADHVVHIRP